jgi:hypothetical protein
MVKIKLYGFNKMDITFTAIIDQKSKAKAFYNNVKNVAYTN